MNALGCHLLLELKGCPVEILNNRDFIEESLVKAATLAKTTIISKHFHMFNPHGVSGAIVIAESHISIHTWPEHTYAAVDIFTCGDTALPKVATDYLVKAFKPKENYLMQIDRGVFKTQEQLLPPRVVNNQHEQNSKETNDDRGTVVRLVAH